MFLASAVSAWLEKGGNLERDYLRMKGKAGSHTTPAAIARTLRHLGF